MYRYCLLALKCKNCVGVILSGVFRVVCGKRSRRICGFCRMLSV